VGSAIENAAASMVEHRDEVPPDGQTAAKVDFNTLFAAMETDDEETIGLADTVDILHSFWPSTDFQASDVADLINHPTDPEIEKATILRGYFEKNSRRSGGTLSSIAIGRRLGLMVGAPVRVGEQTMKLVKTAPDNRPQQRRTAWFQVKLLSPSAQDPPG
jgi:hypothetical protein